MENRLQFNPKGVRALRYELWQKGISDPVIADTLADYDEETAARKAAEAGVRRLARLEARDFRRKLGAYLARRGFPYTMIGPLVEEMLEAARCEAISDIESEEKR